MLYVNPMEANGNMRSTMGQIANQKESKALEEFERVFLYQMLREMRKTVSSDGGLFERSAQLEFFEETMDDALAGEMAQSGQLGIAKQIQAQWLQTQKVRETRDNGLLETSARNLRFNAPAELMPLVNTPTIKPFTPPSRSRLELPINPKTPLTFTGPRHAEEK